MSDRFLITGGNGHWNDTSNWSTISGGTGGASVPTSADSVFLNAFSLGAPLTIDVTAASCLDFNCTGYTGNLIGSTVALNVYGAFYLSAAMTYAFTAPINFLSTLVGRDVQCNGKGIANALTFAGVGGGWNLQDALNNVSSIVHSAGSLISNGNTITCTAFTTSGSTRILNLTNATVNCTSYTAVASGLTFTSTGSTINITNSGTSFVTGGLTYNAVSIIPTGNFVVSGASFSVANFNIANLSGYFDVTVPNFTYTGPFVVTGFNNTTARLRVGSNSYFSPSTITASGGGATHTLTNVDFTGVTSVGATFAGNSFGNAGGNTNCTFTTPKTVYWVQGATAAQDYLIDGRFATTSGGSTSAANFPLPQDTLNVDANAIVASGRTIACSQANVRFCTINFTGALNSPSFTPASPNYYGSLTLISAMTYSPTATTGFFGIGNASLTTAGKTMQSFSTMYMPGTALTFQDNVTSSGSITWSIGGLTANNVNVTATAFNSTGGSVRTLDPGTGTWEMTGTGAVWNFNGAFAPNITIVSRNWTLKLTNNSASSKSVYGVGKTWGNFWNATQGAGVVIMQDSSRWADFKIDAGRTQQFVAAVTTTFNTFSPLSTVGNLVTIGSTTNAQHFLVQANTNLAARFISCDYLSISYSNASPGFNFYAGTHSTDGGNNTGWIFTAPPTTNIKAVNGVLAANIKAINGIPANQIKSVNGIT